MQSFRGQFLVLPSRIAIFKHADFLKSFCKRTYMKPVMCTMKPVTEKSISVPVPFIGLPCPLCNGTSRITYMKFRDRHGMDRIDPELFECSEKQHSYTATTRGLRLLASQGKLASDNTEFVVGGESLQLAPAAAETTPA
jgi:hypothetical protein